jgi:ribosome biogenesis GTPase / thiamine phosphate phosphatase
VNAREDFSVTITGSVARWGWNSYFEAFWHGGNWKDAVPVRVIAQQRKFWRVAGDFGECWAEANGKLRLAADEGADWPGVGDWVTAEVHGGDETAMVQEVLPRRSKFVRKSPGKKMEVQVIAANVDTALLVSALDGDFNPWRVERYLAQCWESGARPVIVLNKADACEDARGKTAEMERVAVGTAVCAVTRKLGEASVNWKSFSSPDKRWCCSGHREWGSRRLRTGFWGTMCRKYVQPVRESDSRGRHSTTSRELFTLPGGALLVDTPGLREMQLWDAEDGVAQVFTDIAALATWCRFGDCRHEGEPGCAVQAALEAGTLDRERIESRRKLMREQEFLRRKIDPEARQDWKNRVKSLHREVKQMYESRKKGEKSKRTRTSHVMPCHV